jgi:hypothetical protein
MYAGKTDLMGSFGSIVVQGWMTCTVRENSFADCFLTWQITDTYNWDDGKDIPCLPYCSVGEPIQDAWASEIEPVFGNPFKIETERWTEDLRSLLLCPRTGHPKVECPKAEQFIPGLVKPYDWPGPYVGCWQALW